MVSDINQILQRTHEKIDDFKSNIIESEDPQDIRSEEFEELIRSLEESNEAFQEVRELENVQVTINPHVKSQLLDAIEYFLTKEAQEKVGGIQNALMWSILEQFKNLNKNLKDDASLKRGQRVEKADLDELQ